MNRNSETTTFSLADKLLSRQTSRTKTAAAAMSDTVSSLTEDEKSEKVKLIKHADNILITLQRDCDPAKLYSSLQEVNDLFTDYPTKQYLESNHVHISVLSVMQDFISYLNIQQAGISLLSLFVTTSDALRERLLQFDVYTFVMKIGSDNVSDCTVQQSVMNILKHMFESDFLHTQLIHGEQSEVLQMMIRTIVQFKDNSEVLKPAVAALNSLLRKEDVQDIFLQQYLPIMMEIFDSNRDEPEITLNIVAILQNIAENDYLRNELINKQIHVKMHSELDQVDEETLSSCLDLLATLGEYDLQTMSQILEYLVLDSLVPLLLDHQRCDTVQMAGLKIFYMTATELLKKQHSGLQTARHWLKVLYETMNKHLDNPDVQILACQCLSRILVYSPDAAVWIGEGRNQKGDFTDPLHTVCLGDILIYSHNPLVFSAAADAIYQLTADNDYLCKTLMEKNAHLALIEELKYNLRQYMQSVDANVFTTALAAGCRALRGLVIFHDDHKLCVAEQEEMPQLLCEILTRCQDEEVVQCETMSTLACLADIDTLQHMCFIEGVHYQVVEAIRHFPNSAILMEATLEALAVLGGAASGAVILNDIGATELVIQVLKQFQENINILKKGLMALQILAEPRLVEKKEICQDLTDVISAAITRHRNIVSIQREALVAMEILAEKGHLMSEMLVERGCHEILFQILETSDEKQGLHDLASECLYVIGCVHNLNSRMLLSACVNGYLAGVECLVEIGADINIGGGETTPLYFAVANKNNDMVKFLLQQEVRELQPSLHLSLNQQSHTITGMLLSKCGQDRQGGTVLWNGYGLGDLQPEWFIQAFISAPTSHVASRTGRNLAEKVKKSGEKRKSRLHYSPSDSQLELYRHCRFRFRRYNSESSKKHTHYEENKVTKQHGFHRSREVTEVRRNNDLKIKPVLKDDSDLVSVSSDNKVFHITELHQSDSYEDLQGDSVFEYTADEWEEWKQNTLTGANIPFSLSDPRRRSSSSVHQINSPKGAWLRKYSLQSSSDMEETLLQNLQISSETHSSKIGESENFPDQGLGPRYNVDSVSSDTDFEIHPLSNSSDRNKLRTPNVNYPLTSLDVSANHIDSLDSLTSAGPSFLKQFSALESLDLHSNKLQTLPRGLFDHLSQLEYLNFQDNHLTVFPQEVLLCPRLHSLNLSNNKISHISKTDVTTASHSLCKLHLDSNGLCQFPTILDKVMPHLEVLSLARNKLKSLKGVALKLSKLKTLILSHNEIETIPDNFVSACSTLETLEALNNKLSHLPSEEISKCLPNLCLLKLGTNRLTEKAPFFIPKFILELPSLRSIDLSNNGLEGLPPPSMWKSQILKQILVSQNNIAKLNLDGVKLWAKVEKFHIASNKLSELPKDIGNMVSLESFDISHNKSLSTLPDELGRCSKIWEMPLDGLNLDLDDSLLKGSKTDLIMYLHNRLKKARPYYRIKLMVIGYGGRGKSTLLKALKHPKQKPQKTEQTVGVIVEDWKYEWSRKGKNVVYTASTWDFAGQEEFYSTHQCFLSNRAVYLVVYDITKGPQEIDDLKPWLSNIFFRAPGCPVIVIGTHYDQLSPELREVYVSEIRDKLGDLMHKSGFPVIKWATEVDCTSENPELKTLRSMLWKIIDDYKIKGIPVMGQKRPASYVKLVEILSEVAKSHPVIRHAQLKEIVRNERLDLDEEEELQQAVRFLHEGGMLLHYNETSLRLQDFYFIDPGWLCQMMARIVTFENENPFISPDGIMAKKSVKLLFQDTKFPPDLIDQYLKLLEKFEIALPRNDTDLLIPCRLPVKKPAFKMPNQEKIYRFYSMPYTPLGFWSRLLARLIVFSQSSVAETWLALKGEPRMLYWREGIFVLWSEKAFFLVDSTAEADNEELRITVPSTLPGYQLLGFLVDHLEALIDEWYPGLTTLDPLKGRELLDKYVPCVRCTGSPPHRFLFQELLRQSDMDSSDVIYCPVHEQNVPLAELAPDIMLHDVEEKFWLNEQELEFSESPEYLLGDGGFGSVYRAFYKNQVVAVKVFNSIGDVHAHKLLRQEATILRRLWHPSVISLLAVGLRPQRIIILEFAPLGTLTSVLMSEKNLSRIMQHRIALQIAEGLKYLHELMIVFRDLKPDNILMFSLSPSSLINAKISDYGISQFTPQYGLAAQEGTTAYRAPEVIRKETYSFQADVFAFGILLYVLLTGGCHPHEELKTRSDMDRAFAENSPIRLITQRGKPPWPDMHNLVMQCLHQVPDYRPRTAEIVRRLQSAELFCLTDWYPISVGTTVECMAFQICEDDSMKVWVASGDNEHMELSWLKLRDQCGDFESKTQTGWKKSVNPVGRSLGEGRILSILAVDCEHILLGTQMGKISVFNTGEFEVIHSTKQLQDSVISLQILPRSGDPLVLAGLANGILVFYPLSELLDKLDQEPMSLNLGNDSEPVRCLVKTKHKIFASCGSRIYILNTIHCCIAIDAFFDTSDNGTFQPIYAMAAGRHIFLSHIRSPVLQTWDIYKHRKNKECNIAELLGIERAEARITSIMLIENKGLWVGTGGGHIVILEPTTLAPVTVASRHTSTVRGLMYIKPPNCSCTSVVLSCGLGFRNLPLEEKVSRYGCVALWDADFPQLVKNFKEDAKKRQELAHRIEHSQ